MTDKQAKEIVYEKTPIDYITNVYNCGNFVEVTGRAGGDMVTYRVYDNGTIYER